MRLPQGEEESLHIYDCNMTIQWYLRIQAATLGTRYCGRFTEVAT